MLKTLALINDLSSVGRCSLAVQIPIVSSLQLTACPIPTAVLSNHTAFPHVYSVGLGREMAQRFAALEENQIHFDGILIGYLGDCTGLLSLERYLDKEKERNPALKIILDPVMADHGKLYRGITEQHITAMRTLCKKADLICPNLTEAAFLADFDYVGLKETLDTCTTDAARCMVLHALLSELHHETQGSIIITGVEAAKEAVLPEPVPEVDILINVLSESVADLRFIKNPRTGEGRPGTGDAFSAIVSALYLQKEELARAVQRAGDFISLSIRHSDEAGVPILYGIQFEDILHTLS